MQAWWRYGLTSGTYPVASHGDASGTPVAGLRVAPHEREPPGLAAGVERRHHLIREESRSVAIGVPPQGAGEDEARRGARICARSEVRGVHPVFHHAKPASGRHQSQAVAVEGGDHEIGPDVRADLPLDTFLLPGLAPQEQGPPARGLATGPAGSERRFQVVMIQDDRHTGEAARVWHQSDGVHVNQVHRGARGQVSRGTMHRRAVEPDPVVRERPDDAESLRESPPGGGTLERHGADLNRRTEGLERGDALRGRRTALRQAPLIERQEVHFVPPSRVAQQVVGPFQGAAGGGVGDEL